MVFQEQIQWAVQYGADFIVAETFSDFGEASLALECVKQYGNGNICESVSSVDYLGSIVVLHSRTQLVTMLYRLEHNGV